MKILSAAQMYQADQATMKNTPISSLDLMEKAALRCFEWIKKHFPDRSRVIRVCCGMGNNGGDGLVISRHLLENGFHVKTYLVCFSKKKSVDYTLNLDRLVEMSADIEEVNSETDIPEINKDDLIIDAIFGIGLNTTPRGFTKEFILRMNRSGASIISIDMPSGLFSSAAVEDQQAVVCSTHTLSFQAPKLAFLLADNQKYLQNFEILDIELDKDFISQVQSVYHLVDKKFIKGFVKKRNKFSHKGTFGHSLLVGGSFGKIGAMILASRAALKSGSGLVSTYIPKCGYTAMQTSNPEVMVEVDDEKKLQFFNIKTKPDAIGIGPGLGTHAKTKKGFVDFLSSCEVPLVIDADGLNIIAEHKDLIEIIPANTVLTPHPKEFQRLVGAWNTDYEKLELQLALSSKLNCVVLLKGAFSSIAFQDKIYFNQTGNPGLATAGSGDVLTGMITGLLAQGYNSLESALLGVYLHGKAADIGISLGESMESFSASDCILNLGNAFKELSN